MGLGGVISISWLGGICALTGAEEISLETPAIRLSDVVALDCVPEAERPKIGALVLAELPDTPSTSAISAADLISLAKRRVPGLEIAPVADPSRQLVLRAASIVASAAAQAACYRTSRSIGADEAVSGDSLKPSTCEQAGARPAFYFDRTNKVVRAQGEVGADAYVGRIFVPEGAFPDTGDDLVLSVGVGPVRIERQVRAAQPAPYGGEIFVRDETGNLFRAPVAAHRAAPPKTEGAQQ